METFVNPGFTQDEDAEVIVQDGEPEEPAPCYRVHGVQDGCQWPECGCPQTHTEVLKDGATSRYCSVVHNYRCVMRKKDDE
jgi:hypothetical protein